MQGEGGFKSMVSFKNCFLDEEQQRDETQRIACTSGSLVVARQPVSVVMSALEPTAASQRFERPLQHQHDTEKRAPSLATTSAKLRLSQSNIEVADASD